MPCAASTSGLRGPDCKGAWWQISAKHDENNAAHRKVELVARRPARWVYLEGVVYFALLCQSPYDTLTVAITLIRICLWMQAALHFCYDAHQVAARYALYSGIKIKHPKPVNEGGSLCSIQLKCFLRSPKL